MLDKKIEKQLKLILVEEGYTIDKLITIIIADTYYYLIDISLFPLRFSKERGNEIHLIGMSNKFNDFIRKDGFYREISHFYKNIEY